MPNEFDDLASFMDEQIKKLKELQRGLKQESVGQWELIDLNIETEDFNFYFISKN